MRKKTEGPSDDGNGVRYVNPNSPSELRSFYIKSLLLGLAAILVWRGVWTLCDHYIYPENIPLSSLITIVIGIVVFIVYSEIKL